jgi:hypothetical protein
MVVVEDGQSRELINTTTFSDMKAIVIEFEFYVSLMLYYLKTTGHL